MDPSVGFEVGAEVELNDSILAAEDCSTPKVDNKQDLPPWLHLCYSEDSSSDESTDYQIPPEARNMGILSSETENFMQEKEQLKSKISDLPASEDLHAGIPAHGIQRDDKAVQENTFLSTSGFDETEISHTEVIMASGYEQSPSSFIELYPVSFPPGEDIKGNAGKYSYYNAKTQFAGTVKPWGRSHKCPRCGRQFGRMYNLEKHICIKTALVAPSPSLCGMFGNSIKESNASKNSQHNLESMDSLENMCYEAQKQLQTLQGKYGKEDFAALPIITMEEDFPYMQTWSQYGLSGEGNVVPANKMSDEGTVICPRCGRRFRTRYNLEAHACCNEGTSQNVTLQNDSPISLANSSPTPQLVPGEQALDSRTRHLSTTSCKVKRGFTNSDHAGDCKENIIQSKKVPAKATEMFQCKQCNRVYNRRCSYVTHMRWHMTEKYFAALVTGTTAVTTSEDQEPECGPQQSNTSKKDPANSQTLGQTYSCNQCGTVFSKSCSYLTHVRWHLKEALSNVTKNTARDGQEILAEPSKKATSPSAKQRDRGKKITSPMEIFICQKCGRVFNRRCSFNTHIRWHKKEVEFGRNMKGALSVLGCQNKTSDGDCGEGMSSSEIHGERSQVKHKDLGEQNNLFTDKEIVNSSEDTGGNSLFELVESNNQKTSNVVPEYIFELVVGSEEALLTNSQNDLTAAEDVKEVRSVHPNESLTTLEPHKKRFYLPWVTRSLVTRFMKRPKPPHQCRDCGAHFYQAWHLKWHRHKQAAKKGWKNYRCDCGRSPIGSLHYLRHQLQHLRDIAVICGECGKSLRGYRQLQAHSCLHPLVSQFQCKCGARFTRLSNYLWHSLLNKTKYRKLPLEVQAAPQENM